MRSGPVGIAVVGAGVISAQYLKNLTTFPDVTVHAIADIDTDRAAAVASEYGIGVSGDLATALALPEVEIVLNLTIPAVHAEVDLAALQAGKHVFSEKPLTLDRQTGELLLKEAEDRGLLVGCAPDTFLGAGLQSARRALEAGAIGTPIAIATAMETEGPERWHPNPEFLFQPGAGPLFDMGPYYLTALTSIFGSVARVTSLTRHGRSTRTVGQGPLAGTTFEARTPTHVAALLDFTGGASAHSVFSFDFTEHRSVIEITGTEGTLSLPDPNRFDGPLRIRKAGDQGWSELEVTGPQTGRGMGLLDLARAIRTGTAPRASGQLALHVVDVMSTILAAGEAGTFLDLESQAPQVEALPQDWDPLAATLH